MERNGACYCLGIYGWCGSLICGLGSEFALGVRWRLGRAIGMLRKGFVASDDVVRIVAAFSQLVILIDSNR